MNRFNIAEQLTEAQN